MKADLEIIKHFAAERLGDAVTAREIRRFVDDNCRVAVEHFGGDAPWADDLHAGWEHGLDARRREAADLALLLQSVGMALFQAVANYSHTDVVAATTINMQIPGFLPGEPYHGPSTSVDVRPAL
ncbi:hypothetical protein [Dactylosporangium darangshiense]|uniref:Uncharacterized protein n=1 Tax=Dactylosporangium darangshiense TaxID=579108 RepID=A0ABP8DGN0_9ACTN